MAMTTWKLKKASDGQTKPTTKVINGDLEHLYERGGFSASNSPNASVPKKWLNNDGFEGDSNFINTWQ